MKLAVFSFVRYKFNRSSFDLTNIGPNSSLEMDLHPSGKFLEKKKEFPGAVLHLLAFGNSPLKRFAGAKVARSHTVGLFE